MRHWTETILEIIQQYPHPVKERDKNHELPLHVSCSNQCAQAVIKTLINVYPEVLQYSDRRGEYPFHLWFTSNLLER
jgi:hypothetical protein